MRTSAMATAATMKLMAEPGREAGGVAEGKYTKIISLVRANIWTKFQLNLSDTVNIIDGCLVRDLNPNKFVKLLTLCWKRGAGRR